MSPAYWHKRHKPSLESGDRSNISISSQGHKRRALCSDAVTAIVLVSPYLRSGAFYHAMAKAHSAGSSSGGGGNNVCAERE
jgi:hypothetical protein